MPLQKKILTLDSTILKVHISKRSEASDNDEEESDDSHEDGQANESSDNDVNVKEDDQSDEPVMQYGVTPFLSGVLPAGKLRARTKSVGSQMNGLIQVRLKDIICT